MKVHYFIRPLSEETAIRSVIPNNISGIGNRYFTISENKTGRHWILGGESMRAPPKLILARLIFFAIADFNKKREKSKSII